MTVLNSKSKILITGGTGSFGKAFLKRLFQQYPDIKRVVIFSRDELKQWELQQHYPINDFPQLRFFLGDIRDKDRLTRALEDIDLVVHAAALKQVPSAEYNPSEFVKTNILGAHNLIEAAFSSEVKNIVALSTDKAAAPVNLYGATKLCSDKLFISANNIKGKRDLKLSVVRYGNVLGSRGSVIPFFLNEALKGVLPITNKEMTRFNITLDEGVSMVEWALNNSLGGEIFVPKIPSFKILDLAKAIAPNCELKIVGIRPGEKIHEEMITSSDSQTTYDVGKYFIILPQNYKSIEAFKKKYKDCNLVEENFSYNSGRNNIFLNIQEIRDLIKKNIDSNFKPY